MNLYQIQSKFRDEPRPRGGLLRGREFMMKDAYSFDADEEGAAASYETMRKAYCRIFDALGPQLPDGRGRSGAIGGSTSAEFQVLVDSGEDAIVACDSCGYAANVEIATVHARAKVPDARPPRPPPREGPHAGRGAIKDVAEFLKAAGRELLKSLVYAAGDAVVLAVVRGDHEVNPVRLARAVGVDEVFLASDTVVEKATGAKVGFAGPVGFKGDVLVDRAAAQVVPAITGANETDHHLTGVVLGRDYTGDVPDLRLAASGDGCPQLRRRVSSRPTRASRGGTSSSSGRSTAPRWARRSSTRRSSGARSSWAATA